MKQYLLAVGVFALVITAVATADDPKPTAPAQPAQPTQPAQPKATTQPAQPGFQPAQPNPWGQPTRIAPARMNMAQLEEEVETLEAHRDVKKAYIRAAEVAVKSAEVNLDLHTKAGAVVSQTDMLKAKVEVEAAKAQLDIRMAEMKEVEVKIKYAKKRLDEAKNLPMRPGGPAPGNLLPVNPKPADPLPPTSG
jgi:hypothetical protein